MALSWENLIQEKFDICAVIECIVTSHGRTPRKRLSEELKQMINFYLSRCYQCHKPISGEPIYLTLTNGTVLQPLCTKCLESIVADNNHVPHCEICNSPSHNLYTHHWWEVNEPTVYHDKMICQSCNSKLIVRLVWRNHPFANQLKSGSHILPTWDLQVLFVNNYFNDIKQYYNIRDNHYEGVQITWPYD
jgi:hypothetical protein